MPRIIVYASEKDFNALENEGTACDYLSRQLKKFNLDIKVKKEDLVYCYKGEPVRIMQEKIFNSREYEEKPESRSKPTAIVVLCENKTLEGLARKEKIPFLQTSIDDILENLS